MSRRVDYVVVSILLTMTGQATFAHENGVSFTT